MASYLALVLFLIVQTICAVYGGSFTLVIDDSGSMWDKIEQVKDKAKAIFDGALRNHMFQLQNFILVTFNDPEVKLRIKTRGYDEFTQALANITVGGGGDCAELSMAGIELGLKESLPGSWFFVFTDASAKDYYNYEDVRALAHEKGIRIAVMMSGECGSTGDEAYRAYDKVAGVISGPVTGHAKTESKLTRVTPTPIQDFRTEAVYNITVYGDVYKDAEFFNRTFSWIIDNIGGDVSVDFFMLGSGRYTVPQMCVLKELEKNTFLQAQYLRCEAQGNPSEYCVCETAIDPKKFKECVASGGAMASFAAAKFSQLGVDITPIVEIGRNSTVSGVEDPGYLKKICTIFGENLPRGCVKPFKTTSTNKKPLAQFDSECCKKLREECFSW